MDLERKQNTRVFAQELRKNATKEENHLWYDFLKTHPLQFRRQKPFGQYIVDFYCDKAKLAIELDGSQHYGEVGLEYDKKEQSTYQKLKKFKFCVFLTLKFKQILKVFAPPLTQSLKKGSPHPSRLRRATFPQGKALGGI